jgi:hypothetical protein
VPTCASLRVASEVVRFERFGGASGVIGAAAIATQFVLAGTATPDSHSLQLDQVRWEWMTVLRIVGGLGIIWFTAGLAARLRQLGPRPAGPARFVHGVGVLWGSVWLVSAFFNSVAIALATTYADPEGVRFLTLLGLQSVLVLTPALTIALLGATGVAVLASPTFPRRFGYMTLGSAAFRLVLSILDWCGSAELAMRIMVLTLIWIVVTGIHLLGATRPASATPELMA